MISGAATSGELLGRIHRLRMRRDFGIPTEDTSGDEVDVIDPNPCIEQQFAEASQGMLKHFGNDPRATILINSVRSLEEARKLISKTLRRLNRTTKISETPSKLMPQVVEICKAESNILSRIQSGESGVSTAEIMDQIKSVKESIALHEQALITLKAHSSHFTQYIDELANLENTRGSYKMLLEKHVDMLIYIEHESTSQRDNLERMRSALEETENKLTPEVSRFKQIRDDYPNLRVMIGGIQDSEATLVQLQNELTSRRTELVNLAEVETTLIDELHDLRRRKTENERILSMTEEEYLNEEKAKAEDRAKRVRLLQNEITNLKNSLHEDRALLETMRRSVISSHGATVLASMQQECRILNAKRNLI